MKSKEKISFKSFALFAKVDMFPLKKSANGKLLQN